MKKYEIINKTIALGKWDTKTYRYLLADNKVKRIKKIYLDTIISRNNKDDYNPNGWETIATI